MSRNCPKQVACHRISLPFLFVALLFIGCTGGPRDGSHIGDGSSIYFHLWTLDEPQALVVEIRNDTGEWDGFALFVEPASSQYHDSDGLTWYEHDFIVDLLGAGQIGRQHIRPLSSTGNEVELRTVIPTYGPTATFDNSEDTDDCLQTAYQTGRGIALYACNTGTTLTLETDCGHDAEFPCMTDAEEYGLYSGTLGGCERDGGGPAGSCTSFNECLANHSDGRCRVVAQSVATQVNQVLSCSQCPTHPNPNHEFACKNYGTMGGGSPYSDPTLFCEDRYPKKRSAGWCDPANGYQNAQGIAFNKTRQLAAVTNSENLYIFNYTCGDLAYAQSTTGVDTWSRNRMAAVDGVSYTHTGDVDFSDDGNWVFISQHDCNQTGTFLRVFRILNSGSTCGPVTSSYGSLYRDHAPSDGGPPDMLNGSTWVAWNEQDGRLYTPAVNNTGWLRAFDFDSNTGELHFSHSVEFLNVSGIATSISKHQGGDFEEDSGILHISSDSAPQAGITSFVVGTHKAWQFSADIWSAPIANGYLWKFSDRGEMNQDWEVQGIDVTDLAGEGAIGIQDIAATQTHRLHLLYSDNNWPYSNACFVEHLGLHEPN